MSIFTSRPALRWGVPVAVFAAVIGGGAAARTLYASADSSLPARSAAQLLVDVQTARLDAGSGTVVEQADLGLPALPGLGGVAGNSGLMALASGSHTIRLWYSGPDKARVALLDTFGESDLITDGTNVWQWNSKDNTATHRVVTRDTMPGGIGAPAPGAGKPVRPGGVGGPAGHLPGPATGALPQTPQQAAADALAAVGPSTVVTTNPSARVAGRSAYELALQPKDTASTIGRVTIAIDSQKHVPLRVQVYPANGDKPAFQVAFTQISFARPDNSQFRFTPPPGAKVTEDTAKPGTAKPGTEKSGTPQAPKQARPAADQPKIIGTGWTSVVVAKLPAGALTAPAGKTPTGADAADQQSVLRMLGNLPTVSGSWGRGHLFSSKLFNVLITDDGRVVAGAVHPDKLYQAAAAK